MARDKIENVKRTWAKGKEYFYFDTGQRDDAGKKIFKPLPHIKSSSFWATYAAMKGHRARRDKLKPEMTVRRLVDLYMASKKWTELAASTQKIYRIYLSYIVDQIGEAPAAELSRRNIMDLMESCGEKTGAANMVLASARAMYVWGRRAEHVENDPCKDVLANDTGEHAPWPKELLQAALEADDDRVRLAVHLLYYTAQRLGDVLKLRWQDIRGGRIMLTQQKTDKDMDIPIHGKLRDELARHPKSLTTIIPGVKGRPLSQTTLRDALKGFAAERGHNVVPHGLRKNAVIALLQAGCTVAQTAAVSGQSHQMVEYYARKIEQARMADSAMALWEVEA